MLMWGTNGNVNHISDMDIAARCGARPKPASSTAAT